MLDQRQLRGDQLRVVTQQALVEHEGGANAESLREWMCSDRRNKITLVLSPNQEFVVLLMILADILI